jgi:hypothetical protein
MKIGKFLLNKNLIVFLNMAELRLFHKAGLCDILAEDKVIKMTL